MLMNIQMGGRMEHTTTRNRSNHGKPMSLITEVTESIDNSGDSRPAIAASERTLNGAILAAEISESYEEYLEIFDHFYADDIHATADGLKNRWWERPRSVRGSRVSLFRFTCSPRLAAFRFRFSGARSQAIDRMRQIARGRWSFAA